MIRMATIWDRSVEVMRGRAGILASIALLTIFLPAVVRAAVATYGAASPTITGMLIGVIGLVAGLVSLFGSLALIAVASDPTIDQARAFAIAGQRFLPALGLSILLGLAAIILMVPAIALIVGAGANMTALAAGRMTGIPSGGAITGAVLYSLVALVVIIWLAARLSLFTPVIVNERRGFGTFARTWELTRGLTWRIIGVFLLFAIVFGIAAYAAQMVVALVVRLGVGSGNLTLPVFVGVVAASVVSAVGSVVQATFLAQLYTAVTGREAATAFE